MSENFADVLNENAGVVGAAAGYVINRNVSATNRNIAATNSNISALRGELGKLKAQLAQEQRREERDRLNREMLFQVGLQVDAIKISDSSVKIYFDAIRVSNDFKQLGFTSATFNTLEDKTFFNGVATFIEDISERIWNRLSDEEKQQVSELSDWNCAKHLGEAIAIADEKIPYAVDILSKKAGKEEKNVPIPHPEKGFFSRVFGVSNPQQRIQDQSSALKKERCRKYEDKARQHLQQHIEDLHSNRKRCCDKLATIQSIPEETITFLSSQSAAPNDRFAYVAEISQQVAAMCSALNTDPQNLPTPVERQDEGKHLSTREHLDRWWKKA